MDIFKDKHKKSKAQNLLLRQEVIDLQNKLRSLESTTLALKDQISYYKSRSKECDKLTEEIVRLKNELKQVECVKVAIDGSRGQVEEMIRNQLDTVSLALMAVTLEKSVNYH